MNRTGRIALKTWGACARGDANLVLALGLVSALATVGLAYNLSMGIASAVEQVVRYGWIGLGAAAIAGRVASAWLSERAAARAGLATVDAARTAILQAVETRGAAVLLGESAGARVSQIVDRTALLAGWASRWLPGSRLALLVPLVILAAVATQSWVCALLLAVSVITLPLFLWLTIAETRAVAGAQQASLDALSSSFQVRAEHAGLIRAFRAVGRETEALRVASQSLRQNTMRVLRVAFLSSAVLEFFSAVSIALLAVYVGFKLLGLFPFETGETISLQEGVMVLVLAPEFFAPIRRMAALHHDRADAESAADAIQAWLAATDTPRTRLPAFAHAPLLTFQNVSIDRGEGVVVHDLTFEAAPGRITLLSGPSGSGKTSCLLLLLGLADRSAGWVSADAQMLETGASLAASAAYIRQTPWLFEGSLADNLRVSRADATDEALFDALSRAGASHLAAVDRGGLARRIGRGGHGLSGGERQRIAIARALLSGATVWLLDEPTAHLDPEAESLILVLLRQLAHGRTLLLAAHGSAARQAADVIIDLPFVRGAAA